MHMMQNRRRFLATLSSAGAAGLIGTPNSFAQEAPPETTTIRLTKIPGICIAPQYVAEEPAQERRLYRRPICRVVNTDIYPAFASSTVDISMAFVAPFIVQIDAESADRPAGWDSCRMLRAVRDRARQAIRDLKGKIVAMPALGSSHHTFVASMVAHVGLDPDKDINFVTHPVSESARLLAEGKVDALMGFPPVPQELREKKIGHVIVNSGLDRPWSQYFCCVVAAHQEFVRKRPVATKRALRALLKATHYCSTEPERAARIVADRGYRYDYALQTMNEIRYALWRDYDPRMPCVSTPCACLKPE